MKRKRPEKGSGRDAEARLPRTRPTLAAIACAVLFAAASACSPAARHAALTLLFDGVPPLADPAAVTAAGSAAPSALVPLQVRYREHGPYAAHLCQACHESAASSRLTKPRDELCLHCHDLGPNRKNRHDPFADGDCLGCHDPHSSQYRYLLVADSRSVCSSCHEKEVLPEDADHGDAAKACTDCHDPHQSDREALLR